ncbi:ribosome maturation factor RimM [Desulfocucumis palustris]|uniref:ribosome maturation factor RimM n=1 Tax=Desulfocucumis palustris TaxID=1898651 RepID=UPI000CEA31BA
MAEEYIDIGKIVNTQGNRGELRIFPLTDFPGRFLDMDTVLVELNGEKRKYTIETARLYKKFVIIKFKETPDMTAAEKLKGALLKVTREELVELPEGSYYIFDLVGINVYDPAGNSLGILEEVIHTGANDVYVVAEQGGKPVLVPALKSVVKEIDVPGRRMVVEMPEEY